MSIESGPSEQIEDIEQARTAADAEKPFRDAAREAEAPLEDKAALDHAAERQGERAAAEYAAEQERRPLERLYEKLNQLAVSMERAGLEDDQRVMHNLRGRLDQYMRVIRRTKEQLEEKSGRPISAQAMLDQAAIGREIPIMSRFEQGGGEIFTEDGQYVSVHPGKFAAGELEGYPEKGWEYVNDRLSLKGERMVLQAFGVLNNNEDVTDVAKKYQVLEDARARERGYPTERIDPDHLDAYFPTSIDGVILGKKMSVNDKKEHRHTSIRLRFSRSVIERFLAEN